MNNTWDWKPEDNGFVYLIRCGHFYKIGIGKRIKQRLSQLQCAVPFELELIHSFFSDCASGDEYNLHQEFKHKHVRGEWFKLDEKDLELFNKVMNERNMIIEKKYGKINHFCA